MNENEICTCCRMRPAIPGKIVCGVCYEAKIPPPAPKPLCLASGCKLVLAGHCRITGRKLDGTSTCDSGSPR